MGRGACSARCDGWTRTSHLVELGNAERWPHLILAPLRRSSENRPACDGVPPVTAPFMSTPPDHTAAAGSSFSFGQATLEAISEPIYARIPPNAFVWVDGQGWTRASQFLGQRGRSKQPRPVGRRAGNRRAPRRRAVHRGSAAGGGGDDGDGAGLGGDDPEPPARPQRGLTGAAPSSPSTRPWPSRPVPVGAP